MIIIQKCYLAEYIFSDIQFLEEKVKFIEINDIVEYLNLKDEEEFVLCIIFSQFVDVNSFKKMRNIEYKNVKIIFVGTDEQINQLYIDNFKLKKANVDKIISPIKIEYLKKLLEMEIYKCLVD